MMKKLPLALLLLVLAGCWTFNETAYPNVRMSRAPKGTSVAILGFRADLTAYAQVFSYGTCYVPGYYGRHYYHPGYLETVPTTTVVEQQQQTDTFLQRARDAFEENGFVIAAQAPTWTVEVTFDRLAKSSADRTRGALWPILTVFFCDYDTQSCVARLKIRDNRTGELVFTRSYTEQYETNVFGLIPLFSIGSCNETSKPYMESWCYAALTDRAVADATAFLAAK